MNSNSADNPIYFLVISSGPFVMVRMPSKGRPGRRQVALKTPEFRRALRPILDAHDLRWRDVSLDGFLNPDEYDPEPDDFYTRERSVREALEQKRLVEEAFDGGGRHFPEFELWDYDARRGAVVLVRAPSRSR